MQRFEFATSMEGIKKVIDPLLAEGWRGTIQDFGMNSVRATPINNVSAISDKLSEERTFFYTYFFCFLDKQ